MEFGTRFLNLDDVDRLHELYVQVAAQPGGFARTADEISRDFVEGLLRGVVQKGVGIGVFEKPASSTNVTDDGDGGWGPIIEDSTSQLTGRLIGSIVTRKLGPKVFDHVLTELNIGVHPEFQGRGVGRRLFLDFLEHIQSSRPDIARVELIARESNQRAIQFYERIGFRSEGVFEKRIRRDDGTFESDIPMAWLKEE